MTNILPCGDCEASPCVCDETCPHCNGPGDSLHTPGGAVVRNRRFCHECGASYPVSVADAQSRPAQALEEMIKKLEHSSYLLGLPFLHPRDILPLLHELRERRKQATDALTYSTRLLLSIAPQCEPYPDLEGVLTQLDNAIVGARAELRERRKENELLEAEVVRLSTPDTVGDYGGECANLADDIQDMGLYPGEVMRLWSSRSCGDRWAACVVSPKPEGSNWSSIQLYATEADARAAVANNPTDA